MTVDRCDSGQVTIDILPEDALLYVFDFYLDESTRVEAWHELIHVCRRWRILVFGSPRRLNLEIACRDIFRDRPGERLDIWPVLPIILSGHCDSPTRLDKIEARLKYHADRLCEIRLDLRMSPYVKEAIAALDKPFPMLRYLQITAHEGYLPPIYPNPDKFLGGSNHLLYISLFGVPIPEMPNLLLSFTDLEDLRLNDIPFTGFFPLDTMVTALSALTRLKVLLFTLRHDFRYPHHPDWENERSPLPTRTVLPSLTVLKVKNYPQILEDFMVRIDAPLLDYLHIVSNNGSDLDLDTPVFRFIKLMPKFRSPDKAYIGVDTEIRKIWIEFSWPKQSSRRPLSLGICGLSHEPQPERQIPRLVQFCREPLFPLPTLEDLHIGIVMGGRFSPQSLLDNVESTRWLELLQPFTTVKNLYLTQEFAPSIAHALQDLTAERAMVLPTLENVFIESLQSGSAHEVIGQFAAARQLSGHPIGIHDWLGGGLEPDIDYR